MLVQSVIWIGSMALCLFLAAGNWTWPQAWVFAAIYLFGSIGFALWLAPRDPALLQSRMEPLAEKGQPLWDRLFLLGFMVVWYLWLILAGLDAQRYRWSSLPLTANGVGALLIIAGFIATVFVFRVNSFAAPQVRVQADREQRVIDNGPYAVVRHPMYAAAILYLFGMPLLLGSAYGLLVPPLFIIGMSLRAIAEENKLARELPGYADYMTRVRYRLIPGVW
jgi:protein-S-isoprenylcysteine O-methyltransferase Ste14